MATILLESLLASTAASSAACQPRHHSFTSHSNSPHLQPYRHLWPTHSRTPHASSPPLSSIHDITLHTATAAHTATTGTTVTAGVPTSTATTTPHSRPSHSTAIDLQAQPTTTASCPRRHCTCSTATSHPIPHSTHPRLLEPNRPPLGFQHLARPPALPYNPTHTVVSKSRGGRASDLRHLPMATGVPWYLRIHSPHS